MKNQSSEKYNYLLKNTFLFTIANFSNKLIIFFLLPFYTAFLTTEEYAIIDLISIVQQLIFPIITLDITEAIIRFGMEKNSNKNNLFFTGVLFVLIGNVILSIGCLSAISLSIGVKKYILYFLLFNIVISLNTLYSSFLRTVDKVNIITVSSILNTLITAGLNVYLIAFKKMGVDGYYISFIIGNIISLIIMMFSVKNNISLKENKLSKKLIKDLLKYSIPLIPNALFWWVNSSLDRFFLTSMCGLTYVGLYAAANKIPSILNTVTSIVQQAWGLSMFKENGSKSKKVFFDNVYKFYNEIIFVSSLILIGFTKFICGILLSKDFFDSWIYVPILILGFYYNSISTFIGTEFTAAKKTVWILSTTLISAIVNIILNIILINKYSCMGAAIATCISYFVLLQIRVFIINKKFEISINNKDIIIKTFLLLPLIVSIVIYNNIYSYIIFGIVIIIYMFMEYRYYDNVLRTILKYFFRREKSNEKN